MTWALSHKRMAIVGGLMVVGAIIANQFQNLLADPSQAAESANRDFIKLNLGLAVLVAIVAVVGGIVCLVGIVLHWRRALAASRRTPESP